MSRHNLLVGSHSPPCQLPPTHQVTDEFGPFSFGPLYDLSIEPFDSYLGWDLGDEDSDLMRNLNGASPDTLPACWPPFATSTMATQLATHPESEPQDGAAAQLIRDAQPADSPWVRHLSPFADGNARLTYHNTAPRLQTQQRRWTIEDPPVKCFFNDSARPTWGVSGPCEQFDS